MASLCLIRPANDAAAIELSDWGDSFKPDIASSSHYLAADLFAGSVYRPSVEAQLAVCAGFLFFGHGGKRRLEGHSTDVVDTANIVKASGNAIIVSIACWSAVTLSHAAISAGVRAYIGFDEQVVWLSGDPDAQFGPALTRGIREMITGGIDVSSCVARMKSELDAVFTYYKTGPGSGKRNSVLGWLCANHNQKCVRSFGNTSARF